MRSQGYRVTGFNPVTLRLRVQPYDPGVTGLQGCRVEPQGFRATGLKGQGYRVTGLKMPGGLILLHPEPPKRQNKFEEVRRNSNLLEFPTSKPKEKGGVHPEKE